MTTAVVTANIPTMSCCGSHYTLQQIKQWEMLLKSCKCSVSFIAMSNNFYLTVPLQHWDFFFLRTVSVVFLYTEMFVPLKD